jgi:hypothetical protein
MPVPTPRPDDLEPLPLLSTQQIDATRTSKWASLPSLKRHAVPSVTLDVDVLGERDTFLQVRTGSDDSSHKTQLGQNAADV